MLHRHPHTRLRVAEHNSSSTKHMLLSSSCAYSPNRGYYQSTASREEQLGFNQHRLSSKHFNPSWWKKNDQTSA